MVPFILLATLPSYYFEPVVGELREGTVHHETITEAMSHSASHSSGHGLQVFEKTADKDQEPSHEHGTSTDHCTHVHGPAHPGTGGPGISPPQVLERAQGLLPIPTNHITPPDRHPPRS